MASLSSDEDVESGLRGSMFARGEDKGKPNGVEGLATLCAMLVLLLCVACTLLMYSCGLDLKMRSERVVKNASLDSINHS